MAPLMIRANLRELEDWDIETYTNTEVIAVNQDSLTKQGKRVAHNEIAKWLTPLCGQKSSPTVRSLRRSRTTSPSRALSSVMLVAGRSCRSPTVLNSTCGTFGHTDLQSPLQRSLANITVCRSTPTAALSCSISSQKHPLWSDGAMWSPFFLAHLVLPLSASVLLPIDSHSGSLRFFLLSMCSIWVGVNPNDAMNVHVALCK